MQKDFEVVPQREGDKMAVLMDRSRSESFREEALALVEVGERALREGLSRLCSL
jgi:hypothetical protein